MKIVEAMEYFSVNASKSKELVDFLTERAIDLREELTLDEPDDDIVYIERPEEGYCLYFKTENSFDKTKHDLPLNEGDFIFSGVFLHSQGSDGYKKYNKILPKGLSFNLNREEIVKLLGKPVFTRFNDKVISSDRWDFDYFRVHITYWKNTGLPKIISIGTYTGTSPPEKDGIKVKLPQSVFGR